MSMVEDEARTKADAARVTREALLNVADDVKLVGDYRVTAALDVIAELATDEVMLRIRGLIR